MLHFIYVFIFGGFVCMIAQILIDKTSLTPARILVLYVSMGVFLFAIGVYEPLYDIFGSGISLPLLGFGANIGKGVKEAIMKEGAIGILKGGLTASSAGITTAILMGVLMSFISKGKPKKM